MYRNLIVLLFAAILLANCAGKATDNAPDASAVDKLKARQLSDKIVDDMINNRSADIWLLSEEAFRAGNSQEQINQLLERMTTTFGKPLEAEFKTDESGYEPRTVGGRKPMRKFWYAVKTDQHEKGTHFIFVQIVPDGDRLACSAFSIVTFPKGVPELLK
ncbi:MAG: hypothetical protein LH472_14360 [Pyrinomonadaceae bacterium]|nr:hypothetical protein [Pyrinomonadaceae bacterium]